MIALEKGPPNTGGGTHKPPFASPNFAFDTTMTPEAGPFEK